MDKKELSENLGRVSAGDRGQDPASKETQRMTEKELQEKHDSAEEKSALGEELDKGLASDLLDKLGKTQAGAVYEDPAMKETQHETEE